MPFGSFELLNLVRDFGINLTLTKVTGGAYNPASGSIDNSTTTVYNALGYVYNDNTGVMGGNDEVSRGNRKCVLAGLDLSADPDFEDIITVNGEDLKIISVNTIYSRGIVMGYICDVRE
tara:strand:+ start:361 stop:717 length:357 start_codon:yes stop_codon:yes gene_type:complete